MALNFTDAQFIHRLAYVLYLHAEITSGAYKLRQIQQGVEGGGWRDLTDDEKLKDALGVMKRHVDILQDLEDHIGEHNK